MNSILIPSWPVVNGSPLVVTVRLVIESRDCDRCYTKTETYDREKFTELMSNQDWFTGDDRAFSDPETIYSLIRDTFEGDYDVHPIFIGTVEELAIHDANEDRKRLEGVAKAFAVDCGASVGTMEFVAALVQATNRARRHLSDYNSHERQAEEWMDHRASGVSREDTYDNINYTRGQYSGVVHNLEGVRRWLESECPLLMAKVAENELGKSDDDDDDE
jgi:hypothetical protein